MQPILGGASYASQDSLTANFGLGRARKGSLEVLWPGGVRNRLYNVLHGERIKLPEIPCSFDADWKNPSAYRRCVRSAIFELVAEDIISAHYGYRLQASAIRAFNSR